MPVVGSRLKCDECREARPSRHISHERIQLYRGPDGQRLCSRHFHEAWDEEFENSKEVNDGGE